MPRGSERWVADRDGPTRTLSASPVAVSVTLCTARIVRVRIGRHEPHTNASYVPARTWPGAACTETSGPSASIDTGALVVRVTADPASVTFCDGVGRARLSLPLTDLRGAPSPRVRLELASVQHFYGLGGGGQQFDRLGTTRRFWTNHANHGHGADVPIPLLLSHLGYGLFFDHAGPADITVGGAEAGRWVEYRSAQAPLDLYYLGGSDLREVLGEVATLLGPAPMPPRWALGYLQSTRHFENPEEWQRLPATMRDKRLPCDGLIFLSTYGDFLGWNRGVGHLECDLRSLPEPAAYFAQLHAQHFHVVTHEYPVLHSASPLYAEASARGYLLDAGYPHAAALERPTDNYREGQRYLDFSNPEVRAWWWQQHRPLAELGVDGWWLDGGEGPAADTRLYAGTGADVHNRYDLMRQEGFADGEAADRPDRRVFLLCRSGGAGMQRFGATCWSGDIDATFSTLEEQPAIGLNVGLSGVPYWGTDVGGFYQVGPDRAELYVRWFQFGVFTPILRAHGRVWRDHVPWAHGPEVEAICRRYLELRYRLLPYTYSLAWQAHRHGLPLMRPLILNYPDDVRVWNRATEYLWGDDLLVAPVTRAGATHWPVYLPAGTWYDFWTHERYEGPGGITVAAPLDRLPLFVRAGAILPLGPIVQYHDERPLTDIDLLVYGGRNGAFTLYEDDGTTTAYRRDRYALTTFESASTERTLTVRIAGPAGEAGLIPADRAYSVRMCAPVRPRRIRLSGFGELPERPHAGAPGWWYEDGRFVCVRVPSHPAVVDLDW